MDVGLVCDACRAFNPMGTGACSRCSASLSLDISNDSFADGGSPDSVITFAKNPDGSPLDVVQPGDTAPTVAAIQCSSCGSDIPDGHRFCGACGQSVASAPAATPESKPGKKKTMFFAAIQEARAKLVLIKGDGLDGVSFTLAGDEHEAGRGDVPLCFAEDPFMSPIHANFYYQDKKLMVRDENSANGVFIRIRGEVAIKMSDRFLVGEQILQVQKPAAEEELAHVADDGTYFFASPQRPANFRLVQLLRGGDSGLAHEARGDTVTMGRDGNDINFPDDPFISGSHAHVQKNGDALTLVDCGSKNGTFLRISRERTLEHGDYVFMGQQLLRVEIV